VVLQQPRKKAVWKKRDKEGLMLDFEVEIP
jgi:hypothetical protein